MALWQELGRRVAFLTRQFAFERELDAEIQFHIDTRADELAATGMTRSDALSQARREFGSSARAREATRAAWQFRWLEGLFADLRYAFRGFCRSRRLRSPRSCRLPPVLAPTAQSSRHSMPSFGSRCRSRILTASSGFRLVSCLSSTLINYAGPESSQISLPPPTMV